MITSVLICDTDIPSNLMDLTIKENKDILFEDIIITNQEYGRLLELKDFVVVVFRSLSMQRVFQITSSESM